MSFSTKIFEGIENNLQVKSAGQNILDILPLDGGYWGDGWNELLPYLALLYYKQCSPIFSAISWVAEEFASIKPRVWDEKAKKYIEHDVLELLNHPFGDVNWLEFAEEFASQYLVTGNNYTVATGFVNKPPLEIMNMYPAAVNILPSSRDGYAGSFIVTTPYYAETFNRDESTGYWRFLKNNYAGSIATAEIWQTKRFNPRNRAGLGNYGMSKLTPIYYEIRQHLSASLHNLGLLDNGARLSMVFTTDKVLTPDVFERLKQQIADKYSGSRNAGKTYLAESGLKVEEMGMNNKDMDFMSLKKEVTERIYNALKVPVALMNVDRATMNNMEKSILMLYDFAVIPLATRIFQELTMFLMSRYKNSENLEITFNRLEIPALAERELVNVKQKQSLGIYKINELRSMLGEEPTEGGDNVFIATSNAPITALEENDGEESKPDGEDDGNAKPAAAQTNPDKVVEGEDKEIEEMNKSYLDDLSKLSFTDGTKLFSSLQLNNMKNSYAAKS